MTLKSLNYSLLVVTIENENYSLLSEELNKKRIMAPEFFHHAPVVAHIKNAIAHLDFLQIRNIVTEHGFILAGVSGELSEQQKNTLHSEQIAILRSSKKQVSREIVIDDKLTDPSVDENKVETATFVANEVKTKIFTGRVRSGQQIYAKECDLVINGDVGAGAEVIADGNIHIYGTLRGRALAGAMGDKTASVFCRALAPELVSIAGVYKLSDALPPEYISKSCIVALQDEQLELQRLN